MARIANEDVLTQSSKRRSQRESSLTNSRTPFFQKGVHSIKWAAASATAVTLSVLKFVLPYCQQRVQHHLIPVKLALVYIGWDMLRYVMCFHAIDGYFHSTDRCGSEIFAVI